MALQVTCPQCGKSLRCRAETAGRKAKCPGCGAILAIPAAPAQEARSSEEGTSPAAKVRMQCPNCSAIFVCPPGQFAKPVACPKCKATGTFVPPEALPEAELVPETKERSSPPAASHRRRREAPKASPTKLVVSIIVLLLGWGMEVFVLFMAFGGAATRRGEIEPSSAITIAFVVVAGILVAIGLGVCLVMKLRGVGCIVTIIYVLSSGFLPAVIILMGWASLLEALGKGNPLPFSRAGGSRLRSPRGRR